MSKLKITQEDKRLLWIGIEKFFLNHPNEYIQKTFKLNRHDDKYQATLVAAAVDVIYVAKTAAYSIRNVFNCLLVLRDTVNRGRTDNSLEAELKIYMINNIISDDISKQQLDIILSTNVKGTSQPYNNVKNTSVSNYSDREIRRFKEIVAQFKRDYIMIFEGKEYMNDDNKPKEEGEREIGVINE